MQKSGQAYDYVPRPSPSEEGTTSNSTLSEGPVLTSSQNNLIASQNNLIVHRFNNSASPAHDYEHLSFSVSNNYDHSSYFLQANDFEQRSRFSSSKDYEEIPTKLLRENYQPPIYLNHIYGTSNVNNITRSSTLPIPTESHFINLKYGQQPRNNSSPSIRAISPGIPGNTFNSNTYPSNTANRNTSPSNTVDSNTFHSNTVNRNTLHSNTVNSNTFPSNSIRVISPSNTALTRALLSTNSYNFAAYNDGYLDAYDLDQISQEPLSTHV